MNRVKALAFVGMMLAIAVTNTALSQVIHASFLDLDHFLPKTSCDQKINHRFYLICYSKKNRLALYSVHWLTSDLISGVQTRTNDYRGDPNLEWPVGARDYSGSGFDRGHLVPAADMKLSRSSMSETFYMSNMTPQRPSFNRGIWLSLERKIRSLVALKGSAYVVTAPLLSLGLPRLKKEVSIPGSYYKLAYFPDAREMVAYLIPNFSQSGRNLSDFATSVDEIETLTGIDFFSQLPDYLEYELEAGI